MVFNVLDSRESFENLMENMYVLFPKNMHIFIYNMLHVIRGILEHLDHRLRTLTLNSFPSMLLQAQTIKSEQSEGLCFWKCPVSSRELCPFLLSSLTLCKNSAMKLEWLLENTPVVFKMFWVRFSKRNTLHIETQNLCTHVMRQKFYRALLTPPICNGFW